jgi:hypothetical protein
MTSNYSRPAALANEKRDLATADRHIAEGEARVEQQRALVERFRHEGQSIANGEMLLDTLSQTLQVWREHRDQIVRRIAYLEAESSSPGEDPSRNGCP